LRNPPYTVWLYVAVVVAVVTTGLVFYGLDRPLFRGGLTLAIATLGVVAGVWFAWLFLVLVHAADLVALPFRWPAWWSLGVNGVMLILLLARPTRRHMVRWRWRRGRFVGA